MRVFCYFQTFKLRQHELVLLVFQFFVFWFYLSSRVDIQKTTQTTFLIQRSIPFVNTNDANDNDKDFRVAVLPGGCPVLHKRLCHKLGSAPFSILGCSSQFFEDQVKLLHPQGSVISLLEPDHVEYLKVLSSIMLPSQLLVFISSSAIAADSVSHNITSSLRADDNIKPINSSIFAQRYFDLENTLLKHSLYLGRHSPRMLGLRLGESLDCPSSSGSLKEILCDAFLKGHINVSHPESWHSVLWPNDFPMLLQDILKQRWDEPFSLLNVESFSMLRGAWANEIAWLTHSPVLPLGHLLGQDKSGVRLDVTKLKSFSMARVKGTKSQLALDAVENVHHYCSHSSNSLHHKEFCLACGSREMTKALDFGRIPSLNIVNTSENKVLDSHTLFQPFQIWHCSKCGHTQLAASAHLRTILTAKISGKGISLHNWLVENAGIVVPRKVGSRNILEVGCGEGSRLDAFLQQGWDTFGIESSSHLTSQAQLRGHAVVCTHWPTEINKIDLFILPSPSKLDVILVHHILGLSSNPRDLLLSYKKLMGPSTQLLVSLPFCSLPESGHFDSFVHPSSGEGLISIFSVNSLRELGSHAGLVLTGLVRQNNSTACLAFFAFYFSASEKPGLAKSLEKELSLDAFSISSLDHASFISQRYGAAATVALLWVNERLTALSSQGFQLAASCASPRCLALLHALQHQESRKPWKLDFIADSDRAGSFTPFHTIPIVSFQALYNISISTALLILDWESADMIMEKLSNDNFGFNKNRSILVVVPFPSQSVTLVEVNKMPRQLLVNEHSQPRWPLINFSKERKVYAGSHMFNEAHLLPYWIANMAHNFDDVTIIDYNSTDGSVELAKELMPSSWKIKQTRHFEFSPFTNDAEITELENEYDAGAWKIALTVTEMLILTNLRKMLRQWDQDYPDSPIMYFRSAILAGNDSIPLQSAAPMIWQRSVYLLEEFGSPNAYKRNGFSMYSRFIHRLIPGSYSYDPGRHNLIIKLGWLNSCGSGVNPFQSNVNVSIAPLVAPRGFVGKLKYTPWPESISRKDQIKMKAMKSVNHGVQHQWSKEQIEMDRNKQVATHVKMNLHDVILSDKHTCINLLYNHRDWFGLYQKDEVYVKERDISPSLYSSFNGSLVDMRGVKR